MTLIMSSPGNVTYFGQNTKFRKGNSSHYVIRMSGAHGTHHVLHQLTYSKNSRRRCECLDLYKELIPYSESWSWQKSIVQKRATLMAGGEDDSDTLIILQHPPVYTLGAGSTEEYLKFDVKNAPFDVYRVERGGEVTYHGPGQIVLYPLINLKYHNTDLHWYLRSLEEVILRVLANTFSIEGSRVEGLTGVWVGNQKIASIGIKVSRWITFHGLAMNVTTDLTPFEQIVPCGIRDRQVGSLSNLLGLSTYGRPQYVDKLMDMTHDSLLKEFSEVFGFNIELTPNLYSLRKQSIYT